VTQWVTLLCDEKKENSSHNDGLQMVSVNINKAMYWSIRTSGSSHAPVAKRVEDAVWIDKKWPSFYARWLSGAHPRQTRANV